jgi:hypothetical protein
MTSVSRYEAQKKLTVVWFAASGFLIFIVIIWLITGKINPIDPVTTWLLQNVVPYLTLITSTFIIAYGRSSRLNTDEIDRFFFLLSVIVTIFYFLILIAILISLPYYKFYGLGTPQDVFANTNKILPFIQSIVTGVLGVFFIKKK